MVCWLKTSALLQQLPVLCMEAGLIYLLVCRFSWPLLFSTITTFVLILAVGFRKCRATQHLYEKELPAFGDGSKTAANRLLTEECSKSQLTMYPVILSNSIDRGNWQQSVINETVTADLGDYGIASIGDWKLHEVCESGRQQTVSVESVTGLLPAACEADTGASEQMQSSLSLVPYCVHPSDLSVICLLCDWRCFAKALASTRHNYTLACAALRFKHCHRIAERSDATVDTGLDLGLDNATMANTRLACDCCAAHESKGATETLRIVRVPPTLLKQVSDRVLQRSLPTDCQKWHKHLALIFDNEPFWNGGDTSGDHLARLAVRCLANAQCAEGVEDNDCDAKQSAEGSLETEQCAANYISQHSGFGALQLRYSLLKRRIAELSYELSVESGESSHKRAKSAEVEKKRVEIEGIDKNALRLFHAYFGLLRCALFCAAPEFLVVKMRFSDLFWAPLMESAIPGVGRVLVHRSIWRTLDTGSTLLNDSHAVAYFLSLFGFADLYYYYCADSRYVAHLSEEMPPTFQCFGSRQVVHQNPAEDLSIALSSQILAHLIFAMSARHFGHRFLDATIRFDGERMRHSEYATKQIKALFAAMRLPTASGKGLTAESLRKHVCAHNAANYLPRTVSQTQQRQIALMVSMFERDEEVVDVQ